MSAPIGVPFSPNPADPREVAWRAFHASNPGVWVLFERFTLEAVKAWRAANVGAKRKPRLGATLIFGRIRWETWLAGGPRRSGPKLNDHHTAHYARLFVALHPELEGLFELRTLKAGKAARPAFKEPGAAIAGPSRAKLAALPRQAYQVNAHDLAEARVALPVADACLVMAHGGRVPARARALEDGSLSLVPTGPDIPEGAIVTRAVLLDALAHRHNLDVAGGLAEAFEPPHRPRPSGAVGQERLFEEGGLERTQDTG